MSQQNAFMPVHIALRHARAFVSETNHILTEHDRQLLGDQGIGALHRGP
jgi:hypothetical protein